MRHNYDISRQCRMVTIAHTLSLQRHAASASARIVLRKSEAAPHHKKRIFLSSELVACLWCRSPSSCSSLPTTCASALSLSLREEESGKGKKRSCFHFFSLEEAVVVHPLHFSFPRSHSLSRRSGCPNVVPPVSIPLPSLVSP